MLSLTSEEASSLYTLMVCGSVGGMREKLFLALHRVLCKHPLSRLGSGMFANRFPLNSLTLESQTFCCHLKPSNYGNFQTLCINSHMLITQFQQ